MSRRTQQTCVCPRYNFPHRHTDACESTTSTGFYADPHGREPGLNPDTGAAGAINALHACLDRWSRGAQ